MSHPGGGSDPRRSPLQARGVHHVSLMVTDAAASTRFYTEVLGFEQIARPDFPFDGAWLTIGAQQVHLLETDEFEAPEGQHFALEVADLDAALDVLAGHGVEASAAKEIEGVCRQSFLRDPTGNLIELNQPL